MESTLFCNKDCTLDKNISELLIKHLLTRDLEKEIACRYNDMRNNFELTYEEWQNNFTTEGRPFKNYDDTTSIVIPSEKSKYPELKNFNRIGVDFPTWINIKENNKRVMFIAQDPLRSKWYKDCHDIVVSSPFGMHDKTHREGRHGKVLFEIIKHLLKDNFGIYLTDYKKFYLWGNETDNNLSQKEKQKEAQKRVIEFHNKKESVYESFLNDEIEAVNPSLIVTLGKQSSNLLLSNYEFFSLSNYQDVPVLPMVHLSGAARGAMKEYLKLKDYSPSSVANEYGKKIKEELSRL